MDTPPPDTKASIWPPGSPQEALRQSGARRWPAQRLERRPATTLQGVDPALQISGPRFCDACFSGDYPIALTDLTGGAAKRQLSLLSNVA